MQADALLRSFDPLLLAARGFYLGLALRIGGPVLLLEPQGELFAQELDRVSARCVYAHRNDGGAGCWQLPDRGEFKLALAPLGALEAVASSEERNELLSEVFRLLEPGGVFALDLQSPPTQGADGVSRLIAERRDGSSRTLYWENRRFEAGSSRLERRLAVEELTVDGTVRKKSYRCSVLSLVETERFEREAKSVGYIAKRHCEEGFCAEVVEGKGGDFVGGGAGDSAAEKSSGSASSAQRIDRHLWLLTRPSLGGADKPAFGSVTEETL